MHCSEKGDSRKKVAKHGSGTWMQDEAMYLRLIASNFRKIDAIK